MTKCSHCRVKKGKRACPYLSGTICAGCCGENRGTAFKCPEDCVYLHAGEAYRKNRVAPGIRDKYQARYAGYMNAGREAVARHVFLLEGMVFRMASGRKGFDDAEVLEGLEYLHRIYGPVAMVENFPSRFGRELQEELEKLFRGGDPPHRHEIQEAVDELRGFVKSISPCMAGSRDYLDLLRQAGAQLKFAPDTSRPSRSSGGIILP